MKKAKNTTTDSYESLIKLAGYHPNTPREDVHIPQGLYIQEELHPRMLEIDRTVFQHSAAEREIRKEIIGKHKKDIRAAGRDPRKHMNPTSSK